MRETGNASRSPHRSHPFRQAGEQPPAKPSYSVPPVSCPACRSAASRHDGRRTQGRYHPAELARAGLGGVNSAWQGRARLCVAWYGMARRSSAWLGSAWHGIWPGREFGPDQICSGRSRRTLEISVVTALGKWLRERRFHFMPCKLPSHLIRPPARHLRDVGSAKQDTLCSPPCRSTRRDSVISNRTLSFVGGTT